MGKIKYIDKVKEFAKKSPVIDIGSIQRIVSYYGGSKNYANILINYLIKKREINKITKGFYTIHQDPSLMVFCLEPSYLGLQDALSIHNLWEQETNPVIITTKKARQGIRKVFENNTVIRRISPKYFFGFDYYKQGDFYYPVSDVEKTFIDMVYFKQYMDKELLKNFKERIDNKKLNSYLKHYPNRIQKMVLKEIRSFI